MRTRIIFISTTTTTILLILGILSTLNISTLHTTVYAASSNTVSTNNNEQSKSAQQAIVSKPTITNHQTPLVNTGPIEDATCNVEQLEQVNDNQLHVILEELT